MPPKRPYDLIFFNGAVEMIPELDFRPVTRGRTAGCGDRIGQCGSGVSFCEGWRCGVGPAVFHLSVKSLPGFRKAEEFVF
jgi:protein-L-isoaspartate(D-aspartate) O-methyltransferase